MQNHRFVALTGHLSNYPLSDLVGILRHQHKSGRLLIEYPKGPATLFFENGELLDVRLNGLAGLQAICVLLAQPDASFNFNPLIRSSQRSIEPSLQRVVSELFGCWDESAIQIESVPVVHKLEPKAEEPRPQRIVEAIEATHPERLALPPAPSFSLRQKSIYVIAATILIAIGISTGIAVATLKNTEDQSQRAQRRAVPQVESQSASQAKTGEGNGFTRGGDATRNRLASNERRDGRLSTKRSEESHEQGELKAAASETAKVEKSNKSAAAIKVVMQIENGRVLRASIANHSPGMDSFEALALRIARQRRYPVATTGAETVTVTVNKTDQ